MCEQEEKNRAEPQYMTVNSGQDEDFLETAQSKQRLSSPSWWSSTFLSTRRKTFYTILVLLIIVGGIMAVAIPYYATHSKTDLSNDNQATFADDYSNNDDNKDDRIPQLRSGSIYNKHKSSSRLGHMNIHIRKPSEDGIQRRPQKIRFPVARYSRQQFPLKGPFLSFTPWIPIFADRLTKQTIIFSPAGGVYIIPPLINFYGKMYSVAELIVSGYASLVSSGAEPTAPINMASYFQPTPLYGPGIPTINPLTGDFIGGIRTDYGSFRIPRYSRTTIDMDPTDETEEEDYDRLPSNPQKSYNKPRSRPSNSKCDLKFGSPVSYARSSDAETLYVFDFNKDNIKDIITLYYTPSQTSVLLGKGDGTFQAPIFFSNGANYGPYELDANDLNHDNQLDIAITNYNVGSVSIYFGDGTGHFTPFIEYNTGANSNPIGVVLHDVNGDGKLDMLVSCNGGNNVLIYFGKGDGTFVLHQTYSTGDGSGPGRIVIDDFNRDGKSDFIVTHFTGNKIEVGLGDGFGNFKKKGVYSTGAGPYNPIVRDFNYDGKLDVATGNYYDNTTSIFRGRGDGTFVLILTLSTGANSMPYSIDAGDFNKDNILDLVVANSVTNNAGIFTGIGDGYFNDVQTFSTGVNSLPYTAAVGDFNNDGKPDIATANNGTGDVSVILNICS